VTQPGVKLRIRRADNNPMTPLVRRSAVAFVVLGLVCGFYLLPGLGLRALTWSVLYFGSAAAVVLGTRRHRPAARLPWYLMAAGIVLFGLGDLAQQALGSDLADLCFLSSYLLLTVALLQLVRARSRGWDVAALLDALVLTTGLALLSWQFLMLPYVRDPSLSLGEKLYSLVFPLADVMLLAVLLRLWTGGGGRGWAYYLLGIGITAMLASDTAVGLAVAITGSYQPGSLIDLGYIAVPLALAAAALHPSMPSLSLPGRRIRARVTRGRLALLVGAVLLAQAVIVLEWLRGRPIQYPVVAAAGSLMSLLTFVRFGGMARDIAVQHERRRAAIQVVQAGDQERTKLAADLHDGPVQQVAMLSYTAHLARMQLGKGNLRRADEMLGELQQDLESQVRDLRHIMTALRPPVLERQGLAAALQQHVEQFQSEHKIAADLIIERPSDDLASEVETVLYRITQEALSNIRKHAEANHAWVTMDATDDGRVRLRVRDNGVGFDPVQAARLAEEGHFGLTGMRERVTFVGGRFDVRSTPGRGTTVEVAIPPQIPELVDLEA
jgi:signal transduction histidine kinase